MTGLPLSLTIDVLQPDYYCRWDGRLKQSILFLKVYI